MGKKPDLESVHLVNHSKCMLAAFQNFRQDEAMLDTTLVCNGMSLKAHKLVLSACSPLFKEIFSENPCKHPVIILRDYEFSDLKAVIDFIYKGELSVPRERLMPTLKVAEELNIRGLKRSEPNREKFEKLYSKVCGKISGRKKRKRHCANSSSDSEGKSVHISASESDRDIIESEISLSADEEAPLESNQIPMDVELVCNEENSESNKDIRPVVLRVGDSPVSNEELIQKTADEEDASNKIHPIEEISLNDNSPPQDESVTFQQEIEKQESVLETATGSSQFEIACIENSDISLECVTVDEANNFQEQNAGILSVTDCSDTAGLISSLSPKSQEEQQTNEAKPQDEGKRFICSKCDGAFTSRINFMRHKTLGHKNTEKRGPYVCKHCNFTAEELVSLKNHLLIHSDDVPYKCNSCSEEFTSEELYKKHLSVHEVEQSLLQMSSPSSGQDFFSTQNRNPEKNMEFRCSICFIKFTSKLRCQFHEKTCQGES